MKHIGTKELNTERLLLRRMRIEDAEEMFNNWANDPEVTRYLPWCAHENVEVTKQIINMWLEGYEKGSYEWGIVVKETNELIGTIGVVNIDENILMCEVGYCIGTGYWGKGYVTEALKEVIRFLFNEVGANRIEAKHQSENINSGKVMLKSGMKHEGKLREKGLDNKGNIIDLDIYSILKREYIG
jgi:ribosomal-protein-alanine N-acetyltransferase